jgi:hypothetical protein
MAVLIYQKRRDMMSLGSGFYIGPAGTGKTYALRNEVEYVLENNDEIVFVINRHGEYDDLVKKYDGLVIDPMQEPLNPLLILDPDKIRKEDLSFLTKIKSGLIKLFVASRIPKLTNLQKYLIDQVIAQMCIECNNLDWNQFAAQFEQMLNIYKEKKLADKVKKLRSGLNDVAKELNLPGVSTDNLLLKETFLDEMEALYAAIVDLSGITKGKELISLGGHRLVVYDLKNVPGEDADKYSLMAVEDVLIRLNGIDPIKKSRLCIDDADNLFSQYDKYMSMVYKLSRIQGLVVTSVIGDANIFLNRKGVFRNAFSYYEIFSQPAQMTELLKPVFNLSDEEADWITNAPAGQKLVACAGNKFLIKTVK